jgi:hypothetical protein
VTAATRTVFRGTTDDTVVAFAGDADADGTFDAEAELLGAESVLSTTLTCTGADDCTDDKLLADDVNDDAEEEVVTTVTRALFAFDTAPR